MQLHDTLLLRLLVTSFLLTPWLGAELWAQAPANDDLCNATAITIGATCNGVPNGDNASSTYQTNEPPASCFNAGAGTGTVWFSFVAPNSGQVKISTDIDVGGSNNDTEMALYALNNNDCSDLSNLVELDCDQDGGTTVVYPGGLPSDTYLSIIEYQGLTVGQTYYLQVGSYEVSDMGTFCLEIEELVTPPNDDLCNAQFLTVGASCSGIPNGDNASASSQPNEPIPDCTSGLTNTVWFEFVAPASGFVDLTTDVNVSGTNGSSTLALYSLPAFPGACANLNNLCQVTCANDNGDDGATILGAPVTPGETYYVQVARGNAPSGSGGSFCLEISDPGTLTPPANDELCNALPLSLGAGCSGTPNGSNRYATQACDEEAAPCFDGGLNSVWYSFQAPTNGIVSIYTNLDSSAATLNDSEVALYALPGGNCATYTDLVLINCNEDAGFGPLPANGALINQALTPGQTYYVQVSGFESAIGDFCIQADSVLPPTNDDLCDAVPLTVGDACNGSPNGDNSLATAQPSEPAGSCFIGANQSVWYSFVAPASGEAIVSTNTSTQGTNLDTEVAVYRLPGGDCSQPSDLTAVDCNQDVDAANAVFLSTLTLTSLNPGETYYVQVSGWGNTQGSFCLEISEGALIPDNNDICAAVALPVDGSVQQFSNEFATASAAEQNDLPPPPQGGGGDGFSWDENLFDNTLWFTFVAPSSSAVAIDLCNENGGGTTDFDTQVAVYAADSCSNLSHFVLRGANDDGPDGCSSNSFFSSYLELTCLTPGQTYYLVVDGWNGESGQFAISLTEIPAGAPLQADILVLDPVCATDNNGILSARISQGAPPYALQWEDGTPLPYRADLGPGNYLLTVSDACDTTLMVDVVLAQPEGPGLTVDAEEVRCDTGEVALGERLSIEAGAFPRQRRGLFLMTDGSNTDVLRSAPPGNPYQDSVRASISGKVFQAGDFPISLGYFLAVERGTNLLYRIDRQNGDTTQLFELRPNSGENILGLTYDDKNDRLLALGVEDLFFSEAHLYEVNLDSATTTELIELGEARPLWISADSAGQIYALDLSENAIVQLDLLTGGSTLVSTLDFPIGSPLTDGDFDPSNNVLYFGAVDDRSGRPTYHYVEISSGIIYALPGFDALNRTVGALGIRPTNHRYTYDWTAVNGPAPSQASAANPTATFTEPGTYRYAVAITDGCGQVSQDTLDYRVGSGLTVALSSAGDTLIATASGGVPPYTYRWSNGSNGDTLAGLADGNYAVTVTDSLGCTASDSLALTGVAAQGSLHDWAVYPNPSQDRFVVAFSQNEPQPLQLIVLDAQGREVWSRALPSQAAHRLEIDLSGRAQGLYVLQVVGKGQVYSRRLRLE